MIHFSLLFYLCVSISLTNYIFGEYNNSNSNITRVQQRKNITTAKKATTKVDLYKRFSNTNTNQKGRTKYLLWFSNNDGIFSQFLQMKIMHYAAQNLNKRTLIIAPIKSYHLPNKTVILCDLFQLPSTIQCFNNEEMHNWNNYYKDSRFLNDIKLTIMLRSPNYGNILEKDELVCFKGLVPFLGSLTRRDAALKAVDFANPPLILHKKYRDQFLIFKSNMGLNDNYTVIHWRRGDQLSSRCKQGRDLSVNCNDASYLISFVHNNVDDKKVYVATNEKNSTAELNSLVSAGFLIFNRSHLPIKNAFDDLQVFMLEIGLMLDCSTFLGWGISEVNDVIENQRMRMKKSYCKGNEHLLEEIVFPTWYNYRHHYLIII